MGKDIDKIEKDFNLSEWIESPEEEYPEYDFIRKRYVKEFISKILKYLEMVKKNKIGYYDLENVIKIYSGEELI